MSKKRDLYDELLEGFDALADQRAGKRTLRTHALKVNPAPKITARELAKVRQDMNLSRGLFASYLRTNVRTLENWELGRAKCSSCVADSHGAALPGHCPPTCRDLSGPDTVVIAYPNWSSDRNLRHSWSAGEAISRDSLETGHSRAPGSERL